VQSQCGPGKTVLVRRLLTRVYVIEPAKADVDHPVGHAGEASRSGTERLQDGAHSASRDAVH
jgi:hypothetical protein